MGKVKELNKLFIEAVMEDVDNWENEYKKDPMSPEQMVGRSQYQKMSDEEKLAADREFWQDRNGLEVDHDLLKDQKFEELLNRAKQIIEDHENGLRSMGETLSKLADLGNKCSEAWSEFQKYAPQVLDK